MSDEDERLGWPEWRQENVFDVFKLNALLDGPFFGDLGLRDVAETDDDGRHERKVV